MTHLPCFTCMYYIDILNNSWFDVQDTSNRGYADKSPNKDIIDRAYWYDVWNVIEAQHKVHKSSWKISSRAQFHNLLKRTPFGKSQLRLCFLQLLEFLAIGPANCFIRVFSMQTIFMLTTEAWKQCEVRFCRRHTFQRDPHRMYASHYKLHPHPSRH